MPRLNVNLDDVPDAPEPVEPGRYLSKLTEVNEDESRKGNPMLTWEWEIVEEGEQEGRRLRSYTSLQEHALFGLKRHLAVFNVEGELDDFDTDDLLGLTAILVVGTRKYTTEEGEEREGSRVIDLLPAPKKAGAGVPKGNKPASKGGGAKKGKGGVRVSSGKGIPS